MPGGMNRISRSPARFLAPLALVTFAVALFAVIAGSTSTDDPESSNGGGSSQADNGGEDTAVEETTTTGEETVPSRTFYTVKTGDTLAAISAEVGVPIERLQELNPDLDPQALVSGQKIRLKE